jgi:hypothetical protein
MVAHILDLDADLFHDLPRDRFLEAFAGLDESRQHRAHAGRPARLAAEQQAVLAVPGAVADRHDDRRVGAREMYGLAGAVGAAALMAGLLACGRRAADAAEMVAPMPMHEPARIGEELAVGLPQQRPDAADIGEMPRHLEDGVGFRRLEMRDLDREISRAGIGVAFETQERDLVGFPDQVARGLAQQGGDGRHLRLQNEALLAPDRHEARLRIGEQPVDPVPVPPAHAGPVE